MITFDDIPDDITSNRLAKKIVKEIIAPYSGKIMPEEAKALIRRIFTDDKFRGRIYSRPLEEGEEISEAWKKSFSQNISQERRLAILRILSE